MYLCRCNPDATLVVVRDERLPHDCYLRRTGDSIPSFVDSPDTPTEDEQAVASRSGPSDDVYCPHCLRQPSWVVCPTCESAGEALRGIDSQGAGRCRSCRAPFTRDLLEPYEPLQHGLLYPTDVR